MKRRTTLAVLVIGMGSMLAACATTQQVQPAITAAPTSAETTTTTTEVPRVRTSDLPQVADPAGDAEAIQVLQRLLTAACCPTADDGVWGAQTEEKITALRTVTGLGPGGLDTALWEAVYSLDPPAEYSGVPGELHGIRVPSNAVLLSVSDDGRVAEYTLAANTDLSALRNWYLRLYRERDLPALRWCKQTNETDGDLSFWWWTGVDGESGITARLSVLDRGLGRVDIRLVEALGPHSGCAGYVPAASTQPPAPATQPTPVAPTPSPDGFDWRRVNSQFSLRTLTRGDEGWGCDYYDRCVVWVLRADVDCPRGGYVEANVLDANGTIIDYTNELLPTLQDGDTYRAILGTFDRSAARFKLIELYCY